MDMNMDPQLLIIKQNPIRENWDQLYIATNYARYCVNYTHGPQIRDLLASIIPSLPPPPSSVSNRPESAESPASAVCILVPACGVSRLSEQLYDAGFTNITSVDFSSVVISHMLERNVRRRPLMEWLVMDLRNMPFVNETFDAIVDNGGLEAVVEPHNGFMSGHSYLSEVKRLLKTSGRYICITLAKSEALGVLFPRFRYGWKVNTYSFISGELNRNMLMTVAWKLASSVVSKISVSKYPEDSDDSQVQAIIDALGNENYQRKLSADQLDSFIPVEDLKVNLKELKPGRRVKLTIGQDYNCILLDAQEDSGPFSVQLLVLIVPNLCHLEWVTKSSKKQWRYVEYYKTARLLMVVLDPVNDTFPIEEIQKDISASFNNVFPGKCKEDQFLFKIATGGVKQKETMHQAATFLSDSIAVDDLIYDKDRRVRCLTIASMERSRALLTRVRAIGTPIGSHDDASNGDFEIDRSHLSTRHAAMISGLLLSSVHLKGSSSAQALVKDELIGCVPLSKMKTVVVGLGAGLLPMLLNELPYFTTEVVEADAMVFNVARTYFGFIEDDCLKVHINDGLNFVNERATFNAEGSGSGSSKIDILILDLDSPQLKPMLTSPPIEYGGETFLSDVKNALSENGVFIINLVTNSIVIKRTMYERLKQLFSNLIYLEIEEDVDQVIVAFNSDSPITEVRLSEACDALAISLEVLKLKWSRGIIGASKLFKLLKNEEN